MIAEKKEKWVFCYWDEPVFNDKPKNNKDEKLSSKTNREKSSDKDSRKK